MIKSLIIGILLGASLLILGVALKKLIPGVVAMILQFLASLLSSPVSFLFFLVLTFLLLVVDIPGLSFGEVRSTNNSVWLIVAQQGPMAGSTYQLSARNRSLSFGRENCDVLFPQTTSGVSRHHCDLLLKDGEPYLRDNDSKYGTYLLDPVRKLNSGQDTPLNDNTRFCLARKDIVFIINKISQ